jgi:hypothetical protein
VVLTSNELVEIRAAQRTFEGAYVRTAIGQFSFALVVLKIFTAEFYSIGALFAVYGAGILLISLFRRQQGKLRLQREAVDQRFWSTVLIFARQQTVLFRGGRRWPAQEEVSYKWQRGCGLNGAEYISVHLSAGAYTEACNLSKLQPSRHATIKTRCDECYEARIFETRSSVHVTKVPWDYSRTTLHLFTNIHDR